MFLTGLQKIVQKFKNLSIIKQIWIKKGLKLNAECFYRD